MARYFNLVYFQFFAVLFFLTACKSCNLYFNQKAPLLIRRFGSRSVLQKGISDSRIYLEPGETITAHCTDSISVSGYETIISANENLQSATFECNKDNFVVIKNKVDINTYRTEYTVSCTGNTMEIFESKTKLKNCEKYMSYGIGFKSFNETNLSSVGLCFDLDGLNIKYAKYVVYPPKSNLISKPSNIKKETIVHLDTKLPNIKSFFDFTGSEETINIEQKNSLFTGLSLSYKSLLQDRPLYDQIRDYTNIFNVVWWNNLKKGNWRFFLDALKERSENVTYVAYTGTSGLLTMPSTIDCKKMEIFQPVVRSKTVQAPKYIWTYLKSITKNVEEEYVFVGYNTPFYEIGKTEAICEDQCEKIKWLKDTLFRKSHMMPTYGVVYCCDPAEVAFKLDNFPYEQKQQTSTNNPKSDSK